MRRPCIDGVRKTSNRRTHRKRLSLDARCLKSEKPPPISGSEDRGGSSRQG